MNNYFHSNTSTILLLSVITIIFFEILKFVLKIDLLLYTELSKNMTNTQVEDFFTTQLKFKWFGYAIVPIFILIKTLTISTFIYIGMFFFNNEEITFSKVWNGVLKAEFVFLLVPIFKIIWFNFFQTNCTLEDIQYFYPLSALNIIGYKGIEPWLIYPLQTLNLFEFAYIIYLSYQIGYLTKTNADNGLKIVSYSYVPALVLWVCVVMFFTLNYS